MKGQESPPRRQIFGLTRNRQKFEAFYRPVFPSFIQKLDSCECLGSMSVCPFARRLLNQSQLIQAQKKYQQIKSSYSLESTQETYIPRGVQKILQPHFINLMKVVSTERVEPLVQILRHAKCEFITFWIYALLCSNWPSLLQFTERLKKIAHKNSMDIDFDCKQVQQRIKELHATKISVICQDNYLRVVTMVIEKQELAPKMAALSLVKGRKREAYQIIQATIDLS